jgi:hypothetical protein
MLMTPPSAYDADACPASLERKAPPRYSVLSNRIFLMRPVETSSAVT